MAATSSRDKTSGTRTGLFAPDEVAHEPELATDNLPIKEEKRAQGLVLCRSADPSDRGQVGQKTFNLLGPYFFWMTLAVKKDEPDDPANVRFLRSRAVMADTERPSDPFQESRLFVVSTLHARIDPRAGHSWTRWRVLGSSRLRILVRHALAYPGSQKGLPFGG